MSDVLSPLHSAHVSDLIACAEYCDARTEPGGYKKLIRISDRVVPGRFLSSVPRAVEETEEAHHARVATAWEDKHAEGQQRFLLCEGIISQPEYASFAEYKSRRRAEVVKTYFRTAIESGGADAERIASEATRSDAVYSYITQANAGDVPDLAEAVRVLKVTMGYPDALQKLLQIFASETDPPASAS